MGDCPLTLGMRKMRVALTNRKDSEKRLLCVAARWAVSRRLRNRRVHAAHGNGRGPGETSQAWAVSGGKSRRAQGPPEAKMLSEATAVRTLRAAGWTIPKDVSDSDVIQVYDTRLDPIWVADVIREMGRAEATVMVGGDFMAMPVPTVDDKAALNPERLSRWGPAEEPSHFFVAPRPHQDRWLQRVQRQVAVEAPGSIFTICIVVPRAKVTGVMDTSVLRQLVPAAGHILDDQSLAVTATLVAERPLLRRVPAGPGKVLPPPEWEKAYLPLDQVLLLLQVRQRAEGRRAFHSRWIRGEQPKPGTSTLELLWVEATVAPGLKRDAAEKATRLGLKRLAETMKLPPPPTSGLQRFQAMEGAAVGIFGVPREQAMQWLCGSGCNGIYLRPFWTQETGTAVARENFALIWARGQHHQGEKIWAAVRSEPGVAGLLAQGRDVAVRVTADADIRMLEAQVNHALGAKGDFKFRRAVTGQRWWKLGPLHPTEEWHKEAIIAKFGLQALPNSMATARAGPFRAFVYFAATGTPTRDTLDDGGWEASAARLQPASPPPRKTLPPTAVWAGKKQATDTGRQTLPRTTLPPATGWSGKKRGVSADKRPLVPGKD